MDTLRSIMQKVDALTNEVTLLKTQNKELKLAVKSIGDKPVLMPIKQQKHITESDIAVIVDNKINDIRQPKQLTSNDIILNIKNVVNLDYVNNLYRK